MCNTLVDVRVKNKCIFNYHNLGKQISYSGIFKYFYVKALRSVNTKTSWCISATLYSKYTAAFTGCPTPECRIWTQLPSQISSALKQTSVPGQSSQDQINPRFPCCFILQITISPATLDTVNESIPSSRYSTVFLNINPWNTTEASSLTIPPFQLFPTLTKVVLRPVLIISTWPWPRNTLKSILLWQGQWQDAWRDAKRFQCPLRNQFNGTLVQRHKGKTSTCCGPS